MTFLSALRAGRMFLSLKLASEIVAPSMLVGQRGMDRPCLDMFGYLWQIPKLFFY